MKRKKPPTLRSEIASLRRAMLHQVKATRGLTDAQQINTHTLNALIERGQSPSITDIRRVLDAQKPPADWPRFYAGPFGD